MKEKILVIAIVCVFFLLITLIFVFFALRKPLLTIAQTSPASNVVLTTVYPNIKITFSRDLSDEEKKTVSFDFAPSAQGVQSWIDNKDTSFVLTQGLGTNTIYTATVNFNKNVYKWSFTTPNENTLSSNEINKIVGEGDSFYSQGLENAYATYPWYNNTPIIGDNYFIGFNGAEAKFYIFLYPNKNSLTSIDTQTALLKKQALDALVKIGVDYSKFKLSWTVVPK